MCAALQTTQHVLFLSLVDALAGRVDRLKLERRQLLEHLQDANDQITDLHDELGPAILRGSSLIVNSSAGGGRKGGGSLSPGRASRLQAALQRATAAAVSGSCEAGADKDASGGGGDDGDEAAAGAAAAAADLGRQEGGCGW